MLLATIRQRILEQAFHGKLVEQRPEEGTGEELYQQLRADTKQLVTEGKINKEEPLGAIKKEDIPFETPATWKWVHIHHIAHSCLGKMLDKKKIQGKLHRYLCGINVYWEGIQLDEVRTTHFRAEELDKYRLQKGDLLICEGGEAGRCAIWEHDEEMMFQKALHRVRFYKGITPYFYRYLFEYYKRSGLLDQYCKGQTIKHLVQVSMHQMWLPLPPFEEQKRIVQKIEALFSALDSLESSQRRISAIQTELTKRILDQAIQGKLVPQLPEEGTAEELYQQIQAEKQRLIVAGSIKKEKPLPPIEEEDIPFDIPETWKWVQLGEIVYNRGQKVPNADFSYIDIGSIDNKQNKLNETDNIIEASKAPSRARKIVDIGDILYATVRPYLHNTCIIDREFSAEPIASTGFAAMTCLKGVYNKYLFYYLLSPEFDTYANSTDNAKGMAYPAISDKRLYKAPIALPPLAEQKRIVAKIAELLTLCKSMQ